MNKYRDVKKSGLNPLIHYTLYGIDEKRFINMKIEESIIKESVISENLKKINLKDFNKDVPLVSIIILNKDGINHLKRLFKDFKENIQYPNYELIVVDNASSDESVEFLEKINDIPIKIIKNEINESFSKANNRGVSISQGEFVLLLNNDIETTYGWLNEMMQTLERYEYNCTVGAKLVFPQIHAKGHKKESFKIQHIGIAFREQRNGLIRPYNMGAQMKPFDKETSIESKRGGVTGAALLVKKSIYQKLGGLDEEYIYGYEDVDFCLKMIKNGYDNVYCPNALLFHHEHGTDDSLNNYYDRINRTKTNKAIYFYRWNDYLISNILKEKVNKEKILTEEYLNILFVSQANSKVQSKLNKLVNHINEYGWKAKIMDMNEEFAYSLSKNIDILISDSPDLYLREIEGTKKSLLKFAFIEDSVDVWIKNPAINEYDFLLTENEKIQNELKDNSLNSKQISLDFENFADFLKKL